MTIHYPDVSHFQAGLPLSGAVAACAKVTEGNDYYDASYSSFKSQAASLRIPFFAYHFLRHSSMNSISSQASWAHQHAGKVPLMVDVESETISGVTSAPSLPDATAFIDAYRSLGGVIWLLYLPRWYWSGTWGSPTLSPFVSRGTSLVSSDYTTYSGTGPGWNPYGGMTPVIWQYSDTTSFNGHTCDFNAYKGTVTGLWNLVSTGSHVSAGSTESDMIVLGNLTNGGPAACLHVPSGKAHLLLTADAGYNNQVPPSLRIGFGPAWSESRHSPNWLNSPVSVAIPSGSTRVTIARLDNGDVPIGVDWS